MGALFENWRKYLAEMLGTMFLVLFAVGTAVFTGFMFVSDMASMGSLAGSYIATALAFGITLMAIIYIIGPISGAHVNPAVSLAFAIKKKLSWKDFGFYVVSQIIGAIIGGLLIFGFVRLLGFEAAGNMGANGYENLRYGITTDGLFGLGLTGISTGAAIAVALILEILLTFFFVLTIIMVVRKAELKTVAPIIIGLALLLVHIVSMNITGTSVNPARSFGVAIFGGTDALRQVWLFLVAPMIGGGLAALASMGLCCKKGENKAEAKPAKQEAKEVASE